MRVACRKHARRLANDLIDLILRFGRITFWQRPVHTIQRIQPETPAPIAAVLFAPTATIESKAIHTARIASSPESRTFQTSRARGCPRAVRELPLLPR